MTMHSEIPDDLGEPLDQHSDTLDGIRHRAYREQSREDTVGIVICDKDRLFVEGIAALIGQWDEFELLAKIYSYDDALAAAKEHLPAVVLLGARVGDTPCATNFQSTACVALFGVWSAGRWCSTDPFAPICKKPCWLPTARRRCHLARNRDC